MAKFRQVVSKIGRPATLREAMDEYRAEHGRHASRVLADRFGVSQRTAQRWLKGEQRPGGKSGTARAAEAEQRITRAVDRNRSAARHVRGAQTVHVGTVFLRVSKDYGPRNVGDLRVTPDMRAELDRVADLIEAGELDAADRAMQGVILTGYFGKGNVGSRMAHESMGIDDYGDLFDFS